MHGIRRCQQSNGQASFALKPVAPPPAADVHLPDGPGIGERHKPKVQLLSEGFGGNLGQDADAQTCLDHLADRFEAFHLHAYLGQRRVDGNERLGEGSSD